MAGPPEAPSTLLFMGDLALDRPYRTDLRHPGIIANLEGPLAQSATPRPGTWNLAVDGCYLAASFDPPPLAVSLANNHIMDYGPGALLATMALLKQAGVRYFGAGRAPACGNPLLLQMGALNVAVLGYAAEDIGAQMAGASGPGAASLAAVEADLARLRPEVDRLVVFPHWGVEHGTLPTAATVALAHRMVDLGADLVVGAHAHRVQAWETYRGKPVFYGLGNCIFPARPIPGHFDAAGKPTKTGRIVLLPQQKRSLAVEWDPATGSVRPRHFRFTGSRLVETRGTLEDIGALTGDLAAYDRLASARLRRDLLGYRLGSFLLDPRPSRVLEFLRQGAAEA